MAAPENEVFPSGRPPNFDPLARVYRWMEYCSFGPMLERCRFRFLDQCAGARRALILGDGDGRFTARLLRKNLIVEVLAVDSSAAMLLQLRRRVRHGSPDAAARLQTIQADLRSFTPAGSGYDLVVSHFFLDCLTQDEVANLVKQIVPHLTPGATWLVSEFSLPEKGWRRAAARQLIRFLYFAFRRMTHLQVQQIPDYAQVLANDGFGRRERCRLLGGLLITEVWERAKSASMQNASALIYSEHSTRLP